MWVPADKKVGQRGYKEEILFYNIFLGERRRKQAENQLAEVTAKLVDIERSRNELQDKVIKLQQETENILQQLEESELK